MKPGGNDSWAAQALHGVHGMFKCCFTLVIHTKDMRYQKQLTCNYYVPGTVLSANLQPYSVLQ